MAKEKRGQIEVDVEKADSFFKNGQVEQGIKAYESIASRLKNSGKKADAGQIYTRAGEILKRLRQWNYAADMYGKAGALYGEAGVPDAMASMYRQAARISKNPDERRKYANLASGTYRKLADEAKKEGERTVEEGGLEEGVNEEEGEEAGEGRAGKAAVFVMLAGIIVTLLHFSLGITGASIGKSIKPVDFLGIVIFIAGLVFFFFYARNRKRKYL